MASEMRKRVRNVSPNGQFRRSQRWIDAEKGRRLARTTATRGCRGLGSVGTRRGCGLSKGPQVSSVILCRLGDLASAGQQASPCEARSREARTLEGKTRCAWGENKSLESRPSFLAFV